MPDYAPESLGHAAKLLLEMRRGVAFAQGSQGNLGYSAESLPAATRAISVIEQLSLASQISEIQALLEGFENKLGALREGTSVDPSEFEMLEKFFRALNRILTEEVSQATLGSALDNPQNVDA